MLRPFVLLKCAQSLDGFLDSNGIEPHRFSSSEDRSAVDRLRAEFDAILVGAGTVRRDRPALLLRDRALCSARRLDGKSEHPLRITLTRSGSLPVDAPMFTTEEAPTIVYAPADRVSELCAALPDSVEVHGLATDGLATIDLRRVFSDLVRRGVRRVLVEGGARLAGEMLSERLVDEIRVAISPEILGGAGRKHFPLASSATVFSSNLVPVSSVLLGETVVLHMRVT